MQESAEFGDKVFERRRYEYENALVQRVTTPLVHNIELTTICPMNCIMCPNPTLKRPKRHMPMETCKQVLQQVDRKFTPHVYLHGFGESLTHPQLFDFIEKAHTKGILTGLSINPALLTRENIARLLNSLLCLLHISLDGTNQEIYEYYRGGNANYEGAVRNIHELLAEKKALGKRNPWIKIVMIDLPWNRPFQEEFRRIWSIDGVDEVEIKPLVCWDGSREEIAKLREPAKSDGRRCAWPWYGVSILNTGEVVPCCYDADGKYILGSLKRQTLEEVWNSKLAINLRLEHAIGRINNELCKYCRDQPPPIAFEGLYEYFMRLGRQTGLLPQKIT